MIKLLALTTLLSFGCVSEDNSLKKALYIGKTSEELKEIYDMHPLDKKKIKYNKSLSYFIISIKVTTADKCEILFKLDDKKLYKRVHQKLLEKETLVTLDEVQELSYKNYSEKYDLGTFIIDNDFMKTRVLFLKDIRSGEIVKMVIPHKKSSSIEQGEIVFNRLTTEQSSAPDLKNRCAIFQTGN